MGRAAFQRVGAGAHRQLRERAGRQEVLERHVVVRRSWLIAQTMPVWS